MAKKKPVDPREWAKRALMNALKRAEATGDVPGVVQSAKAILAEFPEPPPRDPRQEDLTCEQLEERLLHLLNESRVSRGQLPIEVPGAPPLADLAEVEAWLRGLSARGVRWRLFEGGNICVDSGWLSTSDLIFVLVNHRSEAMRAAHVANRGAPASQQPISTVRDGHTPEKTVV